MLRTVELALGVSPSIEAAEEEEEEEEEGEREEVGLGVEEAVRCGVEEEAALSGGESLIVIGVRMSGAEVVVVEEEELVEWSCLGLEESVGGGASEELCGCVWECSLSFSASSSSSSLSSSSSFFQCCFESRRHSTFPITARSRSFSPPPKGCVLSVQW